MAQHDMNIANQGFPATRADLNNALQALASNNSGTSAPSTTFANQWFYDTNLNKLFIRNEANNAFIEVATLDQTNNEWQITTGVIQAKDSDGLALKTDDGTTRLFIKDSNGHIGLGTSSPNHELEISGAAPVLRITDTDTTATSNQELGKIEFFTNDADGTHVGADIACYSDDSLGRVNGMTFSVSRANFADATEAMKINSSGHVSITDGNLIIGTNGHGIDFSATEGGGATSSILDDYEEGTWTVNIAGSTTAGSTTIASSEGLYTKIGRLVTVKGFINITAQTGSGALEITGLPFTQASVTAAITVGTVIVNQLNWNGKDQISVIGSANTTNLRIFSSVDNGFWAQVPVDTSFKIHFQTAYITA